MTGPPMDKMTALVTALHVKSRRKLEKLDPIAALAVIECARDHVALWGAQKISGASRAERNAAIEDSRVRLMRAVGGLDGV